MEFGLLSMLTGHAIFFQVDYFYLLGYFDERLLGIFSFLGLLGLL